MAKITYGDELPDDSVGKKFQGAVYDTGSANAIAAVKGVNPVTQQGKTVVDQSVAVSTASGAGAAGGLAADAAVTTDATGTRSAYLRGLVAWFARLGSLDGAAFTAGSSYVWPGLAGVYQSTVTLLTAGQRGLARLTARRAVVTAGDVIQDFLSGVNLAPLDGNFISTFTSADFIVRDTAAHRLGVRTLEAGFDKITMLILSTLDQTVTVNLLASSTGTGSSSSTLTPPMTITAGDKKFIVARTGGTVGGSVVQVPNLNDCAAIEVSWQCATAPTSGEIYVMIWRVS